MHHRKLFKNVHANSFCA